MKKGEKKKFRTSILKPWTLINWGLRFLMRGTRIGEIWRLRQLKFMENDHKYLGRMIANRGSDFHWLNPIKLER